jgi:hypothetical protein
LLLLLLLLLLLWLARPTERILTNRRHGVGTHALLLRVLARHSTQRNAIRTLLQLLLLRLLLLRRLLLLHWTPKRLPRRRNHIAGIAPGVGLLERQAHRAVLPVAVLPMGDYLSGAAAVRHAAVLAGLAGGHMKEDIFHSAAVRQRTLSDLHPRLLLLLPVPPLALVGVQQEHQLLLDQFPLFRIR